MKTRVFIIPKSNVTYGININKYLEETKDRDPPLKAVVAQNSEKGKEFGPVITIGTSPTSVVSIHYLDLLIYCNLCVPFEDLSDGGKNTPKLRNG